MLRETDKPVLMLLVKILHYICAMDQSENLRRLH